MSSFALRSNSLASSAYKNLAQTQSSLSANISRLSSGLRINSTADDSAGSNVSVRMSNQVRGMSQASRNAQDANNLLATAESGLSDISNIVSKMRELSVQAATDTLNDNDRSSIDLEFQSLKDELTRIANVMEYNGMNVLNGTYQEGSDYEPRSLFNEQNYTGHYDQAQPGTSHHSDPHGGWGPESVNENGPRNDIRGHWRLQIGSDNDRNNQHEFSIMNATANGLNLHEEVTVGSFDHFKHAILNGDLYEEVSQSTGRVGGWDDSVRMVAKHDPEGNLRLYAGKGDDAVEITNIGWDAEGYRITSIGSIDNGNGTMADHNGPSFSYRGYDANVRDVNAAREAVTHLDHAVDEINRERSYIGSEQNKLQFTMSNLTSNIQSIESARSSIEDVDFAAEAADLAKNQILAQSGTAMLAQAAAVSQNILGLLA